MWTVDRRALLLGASTVVLAHYAQARTYQGSIPWRPDAALPPKRFDSTVKYLSAAERSFLKAAADRLIPEDDYPSASQLGAVDYIESQLAGSFGKGTIYYMQPPFERGTPTQGYQEGPPAALYRTAIADLELWSQENHRQAFASLASTIQDEVLLALSEGKLKLKRADGKAFFDMLWQNVLEGCFGDPVYGGNKRMSGWKMLGYPGAYYDYRPYLDRPGQRIDLPFVSIGGAIEAAVQ